MKYFCANQPSFFRKAMSLTVLTAFLLQSVFYPASSVHAQLVANLPAPGATVPLTNHFEPPILLGMTINAQNPLLFEFLIDRGQDQLANAEFSNTSDKLVKYFLSAMTVPDVDSWVNLSPYEKDLIMPDHLSSTEMGKTMLEQDYILKQLSASLTNPEKELGKKFWDTVKKRAFERFGTTELPMSTINKVWIVPQKALVLEKDGFVLIGESRLKVMLEEDYVALAAQQKEEKISKDSDVNALSSEIFREMILPELEKEVNEGSTFAPVRQIYNAVILATWYKKNLRESLLGKVYIDKNKIAGVDIAEKDLKEKVYQQYLSAFEKGVYNFIKDEVDLASKETLPRKYFSGGTSFIAASSSVVSEDLARPSANAKRDLVRIEETMRKGRLSSVDVQLADSPQLGKMLHDKASSATVVPRSREYYFGNETLVNRGIKAMEEAYRISDFLDQRKDKGPQKMLLVGVGYGVTAVQMALKYPNLEIYAVNKEKGLWNIAKILERITELEGDKYSDVEIVQALNRIKLIEPLDIEDDGAREKKLPAGLNNFDMVIIETNVTLLFADQVRVFEKLFNQQLKADGLFAFEFSVPQASVTRNDEISTDLALSTIENAFEGLGEIQLHHKGFRVSYTVQRNRPGVLEIPLVKDWPSSLVFNSGEDVTPVFVSRYLLRASSALTETDYDNAAAKIVDAVAKSAAADAKDRALAVFFVKVLLNRFYISDQANLRAADALTEAEVQRIWTDLGLGPNNQIQEQARLSALYAAIGITQRKDDKVRTLRGDNPTLFVLSDSLVTAINQGLSTLREIEKRKADNNTIEKILLLSEFGAVLRNYQSASGQQSLNPALATAFLVLLAQRRLVSGKVIGDVARINREELAVIRGIWEGQEAAPANTFDEMFKFFGIVEQNGNYVLPAVLAADIQTTLSRVQALLETQRTSSSAVAGPEFQRTSVLYALLILRTNSKVLAGGEAVLNSIPEKERGGLTLALVSSYMHSLLGEPNTQGQWDLSGKAWNELLAVEVMKAIMAVDYELVRKIFQFLPGETSEQETAILNLRQNLLARGSTAQVSDSQILLALNENKLTDFLADAQAIMFNRIIINAHLSMLAPAEPSSNMVPVEVKINKTKKTVNVSKVFVSDGLPSPQLIDEIARLMENLKDIKGIVDIDNIVDDPNAEVVFYSSSNRTVIVPRYVSLYGINDRLEDRRMDVLLSSSGVVDQKVPSAAQVNPIPVTGSKKGGIDFNPALFDLQIKRDGKGVPLALPQQNLENIHVEGFYPVIIDIQPANLQNFPLLLSAKN